MVYISEKVLVYTEIQPNVITVLDSMLFLSTLFVKTYTTGLVWDFQQEIKQI